VQLTNGHASGGGGSPISARLRRAVVAALVVTVTGCAPNGPVSEPAEGRVSPGIEEVLERRSAELMRIDGVQGVGQALCEGRPCIRVFILEEAVAGRLPASLDGYPISPLVTGPIVPR